MMPARSPTVAPFRVGFGILNRKQSLAQAKAFASAERDKGLASRLDDRSHTAQRPGCGGWGTGPLQLRSQDTACQDLWGIQPSPERDAGFTHAPLRLSRVVELGRR